MCPSCLKLWRKRCCQLRRIITPGETLSLGTVFKILQKIIAVGIRILRKCCKDRIIRNAVWIKNAVAAQRGVRTGRRDLRQQRYIIVVAPSPSKSTTTDGFGPISAATGREKYSRRISMPMNGRRRFFIRQFLSVRGFPPPTIYRNWRKVGFLTAIKLPKDKKEPRKGAPLIYTQAFSISVTITAFWACRRFSASSKISPACASNTSAVISSPR